MTAIGPGHSITIDSPVGDHLYEVWGGSMTIEAGAEFAPGTTISVAERGKLTITGGTVNSGMKIALAQGSTATISGGSVASSVTIAQGSTLTLSGGTIVQDNTWAVVQDSTLTIQGSGLEIQTVNSLDSQVTGTLSDGSPLDLVVQIVTTQGAKVVLQNS